MGFPPFDFVVRHGAQSAAGYADVIDFAAHTQVKKILPTTRTLKFDILPRGAREKFHSSVS
jgi:hypothetical protein